MPYATDCRPNSADRVEAPSSCQWGRKYLHSRSVRRSTAVRMARRRTCGRAEGVGRLDTSADGVGEARPPGEGAEAGAGVLSTSSSPHGVMACTRTARARAAGCSVCQHQPGTIRSVRRVHARHQGRLQPHGLPMQRLVETARKGGLVHGIGSSDRAICETTRLATAFMRQRTLTTCCGATEATVELRRSSPMPFTQPWVFTTRGTLPCAAATRSR